MSQLYFSFTSVPDPSTTGALSSAMQHIANVLTFHGIQSVSFVVSSWSLYSYICDLFNDVLRTLDC